jgi:hypothetical protein
MFPDLFPTAFQAIGRHNSFGRLPCRAPFVDCYACVGATERISLLDCDSLDIARTRLREGILGKVQPRRPKALRSLQLSGRACFRLSLGCLLRTAAGRTLDSYPPPRVLIQRLLAMSAMPLMASLLRAVLPRNLALLNLASRDRHYFCGEVLETLERRFGFLGSLLWHELNHLRESHQMQGAQYSLCVCFILPVQWSKTYTFALPSK